MAIIEQQWLVHSIEAAVEHSWEVGVDSSEVTDPDMPELTDSSGEDNNFREAFETLSDDSESGDAGFTHAELLAIIERVNEAAAAQRLRP